MPKDASKNIDRYKIRGGQLNEFEFRRNQDAFIHQETNDTPTQGSDWQPHQAEAERIKQILTAHGEPTVEEAMETKAEKETPRRVSTKKAVTRKRLQPALTTRNSTQKAATAKSEEKPKKQADIRKTVKASSTNKASTKKVSKQPVSSKQAGSATPRKKAAG